MELFVGRVVRTLHDDLVGDRHQRFIMELPGGPTMLVVHNIDVAPRVERLYEGAPIAVYGEFEWNELGGLIHWTHHDPNLEHESGWIEFKGTRVQ
mgnify:FL=1